MESACFLPLFVVQYRKSKYALVAQLDRALASDARCRWFESNRVRQKNDRSFFRSFFM